MYGCVPCSDCGGQRTSSGHWFSPSTTWYLGIKLGQQVPLPTKLSQQPMYLFLKATLSPPARHFLYVERTCLSILGWACLLTQGRLPDKESMVGRLAFPVRSINRANSGSCLLRHSVFKPQLHARGNRGRKSRRLGYLPLRCREWHREL